MKRAERRQLGAVIQDARGWITTAGAVRQLAGHLPVSGAIALPSDVLALLASLDELVTATSLDEAEPLAKTNWFDGRKKLEPAHQAAARVAALHEDFTSSRHDQRLVEMHDYLLARSARELEELRQLLSGLDAARSMAQRLLHDAWHLPMTRSGALSAEESTAAQSIVQMVDAHHGAAASLLDGAVCGTQTCAESHMAARVLVEVREEGARAALFELIEEAAARTARRLDQERERFPEVLSVLEGWRSAARRALNDVRHLALTRSGALSDREIEAIDRLVGVYDSNIRTARAFRPAMCDRNACVDLHPSVGALCDYHARAAAAGEGQLVLRAAERVAAQGSAEREQLRDALRELEAWYRAATQALRDGDHLPLTSSGVFSEPESAAMRAVVDCMDEHGTQARALVDATVCAEGGCKGHHPSGAQLGTFHADALTGDVGEVVLGAAKRVSAQLHIERQQLAELHRRVVEWPARTRTIRQDRVDASQSIASRVSQLLEESTAVRINRVKVRLLSLEQKDDQLVTNLALMRDSPLNEADEAFLDETASIATALVAAVRAGFTKWKCRPDEACRDAHIIVPEVYERADAIEAELDRLAVDTTQLPKDIDRLLDPSLGLMGWIPTSFAHPELLSAEMVDRAKGKLPAILNAAQAAKDAASQAHASADEVRAADVARALKAMDLETLKKAAPQDRLRVAPLEDYDLHNVWDVLTFQNEYLLASLSGLGETSAQAITQATLRLFEAVREETPVRIDVKRRGKRTSALLESLRAWDAARRFDPSKDQVALARALTAVFNKKRKGKQLAAPVVRVLALTEDSASAPTVLLDDLLASTLDQMSPPPAEVDIWHDFLSRPADYFGMLTELGFLTEDEKKMHGDLPEEIVEAVRAKELKRDFLTASLRAYQSFGARFALVQEKVVIGDEMGLGKTVEALAVLTHLRALGHSHFVVVCPAAVVSNWVRETAKHTKLNAARLHGPLWERNYAAKSWIRQGGIAVTTYDLLPWAKHFLDEAELGCAVFDEAHFIKNPLAKRSLASQAVIDTCVYAILMTGTPLENKVQEFRNLIGYLRSDLADSAPEYLPAKFRKHVAPAYLRRNQEDVLTELPEIVEIDEWMRMSDSDAHLYREAVRDGQFMLMRRAAMLSDDSMKVDRLVEIVGEAEANDRRVIVFSYFRDVLDRVAELLPGRVFGPLTGSMPAVDRQRLVDRFSAAPGGAVLVSQITAGGIGLNIQSASVVVICEPQLKPTMEAQAIARAHRMGQVNTVQVHRLLTENSVDERIREILEEKRQLFDEFARDSVIAKTAPDAVDVSDAELARMVVAAERERLFSRDEVRAGGLETEV